VAVFRQSKGEEVTTELMLRQAFDALVVLQGEAMSTTSRKHLNAVFKAVDALNHSLREDRVYGWDPKK